MILDYSSYITQNAQKGLSILRSPNTIYIYFSTILFVLFAKSILIQKSIPNQKMNIQIGCGDLLIKVNA